MRKKKLTEQQRLTQEGIKAPTATRWRQKMKEGTLCSARTINMFRAIYKLTGKTPNDIIDYRGQ